MKSRTLADFTENLKNTFASCDDFVIRPADKDGCRVHFFFIKNICDRAYIADRVVAPVVRDMDSDFRGDFATVLQSTAFSPCADESAAVTALTAGNAVVAVETDALYVAGIAADNFSHRGIGEPDSDVTQKGPRAGFTESGEGNLAMLRRIIKTPRLKVVRKTVGALTGTSVFIVYVDGVASDDVVRRVEKQLTDCQARVVTDSANVEMLLVGGNRLFPLMGSSEKADKVASKLLAGRVGVICDGSPFVLTAPYVFAESIQSAEDYLKSAVYATFMRFLRFFALLSSLLLPSLFTAAVYHDKFLIPSVLMQSLMEMEKEIKLPFIVEMLLMLTAFEIIREVGVRMPRTVGDAVGLVASLLVGDATVEAGLAGTSVLLIVAFSEVSGFIVPAFSQALTLLRYVYLLAAYAAGMYGILAVLIITAVLLLRTRSFGVGYMAPLYPYSPKGMQDFLVSIPKKTLGRQEKLK